MQFADAVRSIPSTGLDMVFDAVPEPLAAKIQAFDEIFSWYGANRPDFRRALESVHPNCTFFAALPDKSLTTHAGDFFLRQAGAPTGILPNIQVEAAAPGPSVAIHPFSGSESKNWPLQHYRELAAKLPAAEFCNDKFDNLLQLARWLKNARLYIGNDSGIAHLAAAIGLPALVLFGPTNPAVWAPRGEHVKIIHHHPLNQLEVETVLQASLEALGS